MKKFIAILAILTLVAGAVFAVDGATETHNIKLKTNVGGEIPAFQLQYVSGAKGTATSVSNSTAVSYNSETAHTYDNTVPGNNDVEVLDISKKDIEVTFKVVLANDAKQVEDYELKFSASAFTVTKDGQPGTVAVADEAVAVASDIADCKGVVSTGVSGNVVSLHFNGTNCEPGNLATYTVKYSKDPTVDPSASATDYYYATIKVEVISK